MQHCSHIDYPGPNPPALQVLNDYDKVYEGTLLFNSSMSEDDSREEIASLIQQKKDTTFCDFSTISPEDFRFVKCVNRRVRVPDGKAVYDGDGIRELYRAANIYVQLTKSFSKYKVLSISLVFKFLFCVRCCVEQVVGV